VSSRTARAIQLYRETLSGKKPKKKKPMRDPTSKKEAEGW
jgi:hypothetical protein